MSTTEGVTHRSFGFRGLPARGFLGEISPALADEVVALSRVKSFPPNATIHLTGDAVYLLTHGGVIEEGENWSPLFRGPGDLLGDTVLYDQNASAHSARTIMLRTSCLVIPASRLRRLAEHRPEVGAALHCALAQHVRRLGAWRAVERLNSLQRIIWLLLELGEAQSREGQPGDLVIGMNQERMAQLVGLSRASVENELRELRNRGAISTAYRRIHILDRAWLATLVPVDLGV